MSDISRRDAVKKLWEKGIVYWKLNDSQMDLYNKVKSNEKRTTTFLCSRRFGKSHTLATIAIETCLKKPNSVVKFLCPTQKQVKTFLVPIMRTLTEDCPKSLMPEHKINEGIYRFPNGSEIQFAGADGGRAENLRGGAADLCIVDEAGFIDDLSYIVRSVLFPTIVTTKGKIILSSTPPKSAGHEFIEDFVKKAQFDGTLIKKTIDENPMLTPAEIREIEDENGGRESVEFRREYLCHIITDADRAIVPEFTEELEAEICREWERPAFFDYYVSADIGFKDLTVILFGYVDFRANKLIIEDEFVISKMTTETLAIGIKNKEKSLLYNTLTGEHQNPHLRVSDTNLIVINDLQKLHGLNFVPTAKDDKEAALNNMRLLMGAKRIIINPKCKTLIYHLKNGVWKKGQKREFDRSPDAGHYDAIDSLLYMVRNIQWNRNPYPSGYDFQGRDVYQINKNQQLAEAYQKIANQFKIKRSL